MSVDLSLPTDSVLTKPPAPTVPRVRRELLTPLPEPGHYLLVMDNSAAETFTTCPTLAMYYLFYGREGHARNAALVFGGAIHKGCELIERGASDEEVAKAVINYFVDNPAPPDEYRTPNIALEVLAHYRVRKTFPDYAWTVLSDNESLLVERAFELPLGVLEVGSDIQLPSWERPQFVDKIHVAWSGRIDLVAECNNRNRIVDHKTTSIGGEQFIQDFQLSNQTIGYLWAAQQLWPDLHIDGFCLNAFYLRKPAAGLSLIEKGPRGGRPALEMFRAYFDYTPVRLAQWEVNALTLVEDFVHCLMRGYFPMATKWCFGKYGKCQYHDVCTIDDPEVRLKFLMSDAFETVTWDPVK